MTIAEQTTVTDDEMVAWAASGAMFLTGRPDGPPLAPPPGFVGRLRALGEGLPDVDVLALLGERAAIGGFKRNGDINSGGSARLLLTADGWLAVNLPRPDDLDLLPAWLRDVELAPDCDVWETVTSAVAKQSAELLGERAQLLGLPVAALPREPVLAPVASGALQGLPLVGTRFGGDKCAVGRVEPLEGALVVDLSSLWAGPLCTRLLQQAGARVVKVEAMHRPDGARQGPAAFFDLLHARQEAVAFDFRDGEGRAALRQLIEAADVVVEASRPRALEQLGIFAESVVAGAAETGMGPQVWVSITGYGRAAPERGSVAFGDDAAAAGGLVVWDESGPCFLADAVADPCAGLVAATAVLRAMAAGSHWLLDVSMREVTAHLAGPHSRLRAASAPASLMAEPPRARGAAGRGPELGEHTEAILAEIRRR